MTGRQTCTVGEAAEMLGIGRSTLYRNVVETGEIVPGVPAIKIRARVVVPLGLLEEFVATGRVGAS